MVAIFKSYFPQLTYAYYVGILYLIGILFVTAGFIPDPPRTLRGKRHIILIGLVLIAIATACIVPARFLYFL